MIWPNRNIFGRIVTRSMLRFGGSNVTIRPKNVTIRPNHKFELKLRSTLAIQNILHWQRFRNEFKHMKDMARHKTHKLITFVTIRPTLLRFGQLFVTIRPTFVTILPTLLRFGQLMLRFGQLILQCGVDV